MPWDAMGTGWHFAGQHPVVERGPGASGFFEGPWTAHGAMHQRAGIRFRIIEAPFLRGIPVQLASGLHSNIPQVAKSGATVSGLRWKIGLLAGFDTVQEIPVFSSPAGEKLDFVRSDF